MENSLTIALSRVVAQQRATNVRANNIANMNTPGYRTERMLFSDYLVQQNRTGAPQGDRPLQYVQDRATYRDTEAGPITQTGNPLDIAIKGDEFFAVDTPSGERYTRAGHFTLNQDRQIVDVDGNAVLGASGQPITIPEGTGNIAITADGTVSTENGTVGKLRIVGFDRLENLRVEGSRNYRADGVEATQVDTPHLVQGAIEESNVKPVIEITQLIDAQREFEMAVQFVDKEGERLSSIAEKLLRRRS